MGLFANALSIASGQIRSNERTASGRRGLAGWLLERVRRRSETQSRLRLVERILIAPRQAIALVEADGQKLLIATAPEGAPSFCLLDSNVRGARKRAHGGIPLEGTIG